MLMKLESLKESPVLNQQLKSALWISALLHNCWGQSYNSGLNVPRSLLEIALHLPELHFQFLRLHFEGASEWAVKRGRLMSQLGIGLACSTYIIVV
jgi:hypothetical protein